jgi:hypothetical protein
MFRYDWNPGRSICWNWNGWPHLQHFITKLRMFRYDWNPHIITSCPYVWVRMRGAESACPYVWVRMRGAESESTPLHGAGIAQTVRRRDWSGRPGLHSRQGQEIFCTPQRRDWLWSPHGLLSIGIRSVKVTRCQGQELGDSTLAPPYVFMAWCLIKSARGQFSIYIISAEPVKNTGIRKHVAQCL